MVAPFAAWQSAPWLYYQWRIEHMDTGAVPIIAEASEGLAGLLLFLVIVGGVAFWQRDKIKAAWQKWRGKR